MSRTKETPNSSRSLSTTDPELLDADRQLEVEKEDQGKRAHNFVPASMFPKMLGGHFVVLMITFLAAPAWLFGTVYRMREHTHQLHVAVADFDGSSVGTALREATMALSGTMGYPTFDQLDVSEWTPESLAEAVFQGHYWGGMVASEGATDRYDTAIASSAGATAYNSSDAIYYVTMESNYYAIYSEDVLGAMSPAAAEAAALFSQNTVTATISNLSTSNPTLLAQVASVLSSPINPVQVELVPWFVQGTKVLLNTAGMVTPVLSQFFFLMGYHNIMEAVGFRRNWTRTRGLSYQFILSFVWPLFISLDLTVIFEVFKESYPTTGAQFFALWTVNWVMTMILFGIFDIVTCFVPLPLIPPFVLTLVFMHVACGMMPIAATNHFYRVSYFFPALHHWKTMITILTKGGVNNLHYTLPTLAGWLVVAKGMTYVSESERMRRAHAGEGPKH
ncbi:hypothetical protein MNV49_000125 [Pseudohyphozyma bogoriensis]|nr:hypothetical protein MNV49_000125 [Pseudohyphozyma bogoriensis]